MNADAIHRIENPSDEQAHALHLYAGDFSALMDVRSLWSADALEEKAFSFPELVKESVATMHRSGNSAGLAALADAMPAAKAIVDAL